MLVSWATFAVAVASFSRLWQGVRAALEGERLYGPLEALLWIALFLSSLGCLAFMIYAADRAAGRAKRSIPVFDRLLDRRRRERASARTADPTASPARTDGT